MLLVRKGNPGPVNAKVGQKVTYRVTEFSRSQISPAEAATVHWLVKSTDGAALLSERNVGPVPRACRAADLVRAECHHDALRAVTVGRDRCADSGDRRAAESRRRTYSGVLPRGQTSLRERRR